MLRTTPLCVRNNQQEAKISKKRLKNEMEPLAVDNEDTPNPKGYGTYNDAVHSMAEEQEEKKNEETAEKNVWNTDMYKEVDSTESMKALQTTAHEINGEPQKPKLARPTELIVSRDDTDFSINAIHNSNTSFIRREKKQVPPLVITTKSQSPVLGSPDSDGDILGFVDHTPDPLPDSTDYARTHTYSKVFHITKYSELMPGVFIPEHPVHLSISNVQPSHSHINIFNNHILVIDMEHGDFKWSVQRKVKSVTSLNNVLFLLRTKLKLPAATRGARQRRLSMRVQMKEADREGDAIESVGTINGKRLLKYPRRALQTMDSTAQSELEVYLKNLMHHSLFRSHQAVLEFFEISPVSFISELGQKIKEGYVKKRIGGYNGGCCRWCTSPCTGKYKQRWLVLKETCLFFLSPETGEVRAVMLMDTGFQVSHGYRLLGVRNGLLISNLTRSLVIKCDSELSKKEWYAHITNTQRKYSTDFTSQDTRYNAFAPVRCNSYACWYVDGARYMWDVADILESAKEEIFITDWWMSPEIYLKRPDLTGNQWRLAEVLKRQAERGVRIFILLYKEVELALGISSILTKATISSLHPNIKVLRHPDHYAGGVLYWAHHEKMVIVDQMYAFISGIDLAFGRWDDYRHKLVDVGHAGVQMSSRPTGLGSALQQLVRGTNDVLVNTMTRSTPSSRRTSLDASFSLDQTQSTTASSLFLNPSDCSPNVPNAGVLDNEVNTLSQGDSPVKEATTVTFVTGSELDSGWNKTLETEKDSGNESSPGRVITLERKVENIPLQSPGRSKHHKRGGSDATRDGETHSNSEGEHSEGKMGKSIREVKRMGLDLVEEVKEKGRGVRAWTANKIPQLQRKNLSDLENSDSSSSSDEEKEETKKRLGYKNRLGSCSSLAQANSALTVEDTTSVHLWVGKDYVNWISKDLNNLDKPFQDIVDRHQTPRMPWHDIGLFVEGPAARDAARHFIQRWNAVKTEKAKPNSKYPYLLPRTYDKKSFQPSNLQRKHKVSAQVLRSVGKWSAGLEEEEASIFSAYVSLIRNAKHYIYIENQFFITCASSTGSRDVSNYIGHEIVERIVQAHSNNEVFRVFILLPLLPAFEGMIGKSSGVAMQYIVYWNYVSISRGKTSLIHCLKERGVDDWEKYVSFCSLRTHECLEGRAVSELIYIHSKLMIVDDRFVIAGSANINDRSLKGNRDSEVCLVLEDHEFVQGVMNGQSYQCGVFAGSMRKYLFSEHLGIADDESPVIDVTDPVSDSFYISTWCDIAKKNTVIYEEVFSCYPCNSATTFEEVDRLRNTTSKAEISPSEALEKLKEIQGHLVCFPLDFLKDEILKPGVGNKEYLLPMETWT
ncbi:phospholipase D1-like isoform X4 [Penaeus japonicus]|uniref:phospholipase D1-like isoform X4 n=1 Tax=Penaeus japonicus TaxID=27405 RepID=UPI001C716C1D|nr:phospholipase D1-like isoform X4 [Penaeus japonicus]